MSTNEKLTAAVKNINQVSALLLSLRSSVDNLDNTDIAELVDLSLDLLVEPAGFMYTQQRIGNNATSTATSNMARAPAEDFARIEKHLNEAMRIALCSENKPLALKFVAAGLDIARNAAKADTPVTGA